MGRVYTEKVKWPYHVQDKSTFFPRRNQYTSNNNTDLVAEMIDTLLRPTHFSHLSFFSFSFACNNNNSISMLNFVLIYFVRHIIADNLKLKIIENTTFSVRGICLNMFMYQPNGCQLESNIAKSIHDECCNLMNVAANDAATRNCWTAGNLHHWRSTMGEIQFSWTSI